MSDVARIYDLIKSICQAERISSYPMMMCYGTVVSKNPFQIRIDQKNILGKAFFMVAEGTTINSFEVGDRLILLRQQGGQEYLIFGKKGAL